MRTSTFLLALAALTTPLTLAQSPSSDSTATATFYSTRTVYRVTTETAIGTAPASVATIASTTVATVVSAPFPVGSGSSAPGNATVSGVGPSGAPPAQFTGAAMRVGAGDFGGVVVAAVAGVVMFAL
ncbi:hypothetical protein K402DRAFT_216244 [Aulographum hederae CBS 113979]|uniref:Uncharacterized protein n=1 Tax=Aulographum hederae CBS 113979 TaxID=1176131 RepID=A0A6G1GMN1_9PEZI|nr:hypothetical protein K402DRAFT_216244 [Aulographum hederae CBS 113979]